ncbi:MAG: flagellar basal body-associated FliL family protein [Alphaproteobacteria bacterium]|nr:flagellar basal body-associated FliL family protein [Alphaproteobacteria bacterium]
MSDAAAAKKTEISTEATETVATETPKKSKLPLILMIVLPILTLGIGGGVAYVMGFLSFGAKKPQEQAADGEKGQNKAEGGHNEAKAEGAEGSGEHDKLRTSIFHPLPEMMINLNSEVGKVSYLKIQASLELDDQKSIEKLQKVMPRIQDTIQVYVRELKVADLKSSIGIEKLRQELLKRIQLIAKDVKVFDVLFPQMLTQ